MQDKAVLAFNQVCRDYPSAKETVHALRDVSISIHAGSVVTVMGPSGSGKSTFLNLAVGLERPTSGSVLLLGHNTTNCSEDELADIRAQHVGFIFQQFHLLPGLTALENVMLPLELIGKTKRRETASELLSRVGLAERSHHYPYQLSGGEQQRVAIARAYVHSPQLLLADEPTGNLDYESGAVIADLLFTLNREQNTTLILATHDRELAARTPHCLRLRGGRLESESSNSLGR